MAFQNEQVRGAWPAARPNARNAMASRDRLISFVDGAPPAHMRFQSHTVQRKTHSSDISGFWHAQLFLDCFVYSLLGHKCGGYFIDLAANDAISMSNTKSLERDYSWRGLCVEPNPKYHPGLLQYRDCAVSAAAVSNEYGEANFDFKESTASAKGGGEYGGGGVFGGFTAAKTATSTLVRTAPFSYILDEHAVPSHIDFMSLDVEGAEMLVMRSFPFAKRKVTLMAIERPPSDLVTLLHTHAYRSLCVTRTDVLFAHVPTLQRLQARGEVPAWATQGCGGTGASNLLKSATSAKVTVCTCQDLIMPQEGMCRTARKIHKHTGYSTSGQASIERCRPPYCILKPPNVTHPSCMHGAGWRKRGGNVTG